MKSPYRWWWSVVSVLFIVVAMEAVRRLYTEPHSFSSEVPVMSQTPSKLAELQPQEKEEFPPRVFQDHTVIGSLGYSLPESWRFTDEKQSPQNPAVYYAIAKDAKGNEEVFRMDTTHGTSVKLFSNTIYQDFRDGVIGSVSPNDKAIMFGLVACADCGEGRMMGRVVYHIEKGIYHHLGYIEQFRWTEGENFQYKLTPVGCYEILANPFRDTRDHECDRRLEESAWLSGNW